MAILKAHSKWLLLKMSRSWSLHEKKRSRDANKKHKRINRCVWLTRVRLWGLLRDFHSSVLETSDSTGTINSVIRAKSVNLDAQHTDNHSVGLHKPSPASDNQNILTWPKNSHVCSACSHRVSLKPACLFPKRFFRLLLYTVCKVYHMWTIFTFWQIGILFLFKETLSAIIDIINLPYSVIMAPLETYSSE